MKNYILILFLAFTTFGCDGDEPGPGNGEVTVNYSISMEDFPNPERGFYVYSETRASQYEALDVTYLKSIRQPGTSSGASYQTVSTLVFRYFILDDFVDGPISEEFLTKMDEDFSAAREAGVKLIPRFTYTVTSHAGDCPEDFICPPYGDASKEIILSQIAQISPVITKNVDVIACLQMGFIGTWGENYYTDYFGDASSNGDQGKLLDENWQDRIDVLKAILDATPDELMIQVRYPQIKQRYVYGIDAGVNSAPLTPEEAYSGTDKARIAYHNDCLFASSDDYGTYEDYGNSSSPRKTSVAALKGYFKEDSKYLVVGGETCSDDYSPQNDCSPAGMADSDLRDLHYTFLNSEYNNDVNNDWVDGGCMDAIKRNLGYRFQLLSGTYPEEVARGTELKATIELENSGYATPIKERPVRLVLRNKTDDAINVFNLDTDVRFWEDAVTLHITVDLPENLLEGEYDMLLSIPDGHESLEDVPEYSIRLANDQAWEASTGYNNLLHTLMVTGE